MKQNEPRCKGSDITASKEEGKLTATSNKLVV